MIVEKFVSLPFYMNFAKLVLILFCFNECEISEPSIQIPCYDFHLSFCWK